jgi:hypothetical protein
LRVFPDGLNDLFYTQKTIIPPGTIENSLHLFADQTEIRNGSFFCLLAIGLKK